MQLVRLAADPQRHAIADSRVSSALLRFRIENAHKTRRLASAVQFAGNRRAVACGSTAHIIAHVEQTNRPFSRHRPIDRVGNGDVFAHKFCAMGVQIILQTGCQHARAVWIAICHHHKCRSHFFDIGVWKPEQDAVRQHPRLSQHLIGQFAHRQTRRRSGQLPFDIDANGGKRAGLRGRHLAF